MLGNASIHTQSLMFPHRQGVSVRTFAQYHAGLLPFIHAGTTVTLVRGDISPVSASNTVRRTNPLFFDDTLAAAPAQRVGSNHVVNSLIVHDISQFSYGAGSTPMYTSTPAFIEQDDISVMSASSFLGSIFKVVPSMMPAPIPGLGTFNIPSTQLFPANRTAMNGVIETHPIISKFPLSLSASFAKSNVSARISSMYYEAGDDWGMSIPITQYYGRGPSNMGFKDAGDYFYTSSLPLEGGKRKYPRAMMMHQQDPFFEDTETDMNIWASRGAHIFAPLIRGNLYGVITQATASINRTVPMGKTSAAAGFVYTLSNLTGSYTQGVDSIAFGGLKR